MINSRCIIRDVFGRYYFKNSDFQTEFKAFCIQEKVWLRRYHPISYSGYTQYDLVDEAFRKAVKEYAKRSGVRIRYLRKRIELKKNPRQLEWYFCED